MPPQIVPGLYRHFKGGLYLVLGEFIHTETGEELVAYKALYGNFQSSARPKAMFLDEVDRPDFNYKGPRFILEKRL
jgi:hypothetical protein